MSSSQYILLGVIALTTWVGFIQATALLDYRMTVARFVLALVVPCIWAALIVFLPLDIWLSSFAKPPASLVQIIIRLLVLLSVIAAPFWFIFPIVYWVGGALCGDLKDSLKECFGLFLGPKS